MKLFKSVITVLCLLLGKCIVYRGDVFNVTYFIHEGEVEKWYSDGS